MSYPIKKLFDSRFIKVFDLQYAPGKHYYDATRRDETNLTAIKTADEFAAMLPDAVSCCVIFVENDKKYILLSREYRYPLGQYVISVPAGLIDEDPSQAEKSREQMIVQTAVRELKEETGITFTEKDEISVLNACLFSSPGFTDESNALVQITLKGHHRDEFSQCGAVGDEKFNGFLLADASEAKRIMQEERISTYTWMGLSAFLADLHC